MTEKPLAAIVTAGLSKFGKLDGLSAREIFTYAVKEAFDKCPNLDPRKDVKGLYVGHMTESAEQSIIKQVPLKRVGEPADIASTILFLVKDAPYITGQIIAVDGGRSVGW